MLDDLAESGDGPAGRDVSGRGKERNLGFQVLEVGFMGNICRS
jgi:hypothetical protein